MGMAGFKSPRHIGIYRVFFVVWSADIGRKAIASVAERSPHLLEFFPLLAEIDSSIGDPVSHGCHRFDCLRSI